MNNTSANINIYDREAAAALNKFAAYIDGGVNDVVAVVSSAPPEAKVREALQATSQQLGYEKRISWISLCGVNGESEILPANELAALIERIDPVVMVATDVGAMSQLSVAYSLPLEADSANRILGRTLVAFNSFASMLENADSKQKAWRLLKQLRFLA